MFTCIKCQHRWFQRSEKPPRRCPNHACRSALWNTNLTPLAAKTVPSEKSKVLEELKSLLVAPPKPKVVAPIIPPQVVDQPDYYSEPSVSYD